MIQVYYKGEFYKNKKTISSALCLVRKICLWDNARPVDFHIWTKDKGGNPLKLRVSEELETVDYSWVN